jgi:hypothetical protein
MWDAYAVRAGGKTFDGKPLPTWDELGDERQSCWIAAASVTADHIEKLEATLRWICGSRTIEYFDGTVQADETKMLWTYRRIAREALEGTYDERIFKDPT